MGARLAAVTGNINMRLYKPHDKWSVQPADEAIEVGDGDLMRCMMSSCKKNGYRMLHLESCAFRALNRINTPITGAKANEPALIHELDSAEGTMDIVEVNV